MIGMFSLRLTPTTFISLESTARSRNTRITASVVVCALKGPRPRYPRVWKVNKKFGTISKSTKLVECVKGLSNVKEEVYGALDSFIAWELEFPLITVKKALKLLENEKEWKKVIQLTKWMLSKGQGRTMGSYFTLLNALAADGRIDEAEELWKKLFSEHLESTPRIFFDKMVSIYYQNEMHDKMFEIFADMEELGVRPNVSIVSMVGDVFKKLDMMDKYTKLKKKYPPPKWEYRYIKGKRVKIQAKRLAEFDNKSKPNYEDKEKDDDPRKPYIRPVGVTNSTSSFESEESEVHGNHLLDDESNTDYANKELDDDASEAFDDSTEEMNYAPDLAYEESEMNAHELYIENHLSS